MITALAIGVLLAAMALNQPTVVLVVGMIALVVAVNRRWQPAKTPLRRRSFGRPPAAHIGPSARPDTLPEILQGGLGQAKIAAAEGVFKPEPSPTCAGNCRDRRPACEAEGERRGVRFREPPHWPGLATTGATQPQEGPEPYFGKPPKPPPRPMRPRRRDLSETRIEPASIACRTKRLDRHNRNASAASHVCSTFSASSPSARVRPRLTAATGFPSRAAISTKRKPE